MKNIVLHYHLFKNAGSSVDNILKDSFGAKWVNWDKPVDKPGRILPAEIASYIEKNPHVKAISSHDVVPPLPVGNFQIFPIVFLRHPIVRARSAYLFEWKKELGLDQPKGSFSEYIAANLPKSGNSVIANFQVNKLSNIVYGDDVSRKPLRDYELLERAKLFLTTIPYFGLVEHFQQSLVRMHYYLRVAFPEIKVVNHQANVMQDVNINLEEKLAKIKEELGDELYTKICDRNELDLKLYNFAVNHFFSVVHPK